MQTLNHLIRGFGNIDDFRFTQDPDKDLRLPLVRLCFVPTCA